MEKQKICFVCTGNTCRSPMAEKFFKAHIGEMGIQNVEVESRGLVAVKGEFVAPEAVFALKKNGLRMGKRLSKQLTNKEMISKTLFVVMTKEQKQCFSPVSRVFSLGEMVSMPDVPDPYGLSQDVYNSVATQINIMTYKLAQKLKQLSSGEQK